MLKNDTLKNGTSRTGLYGSAPPPPEVYYALLVNTAQYFSTLVWSAGFLRHLWGLLRNYVITNKEKKLNYM